MTQNQSTNIKPEQRFTKGHPCPICGGYDGSKRGESERCYGFLSEDGSYAHCTREEYAGSIDRNPKTEGFPHKLTGDCKCGTQHGQDYNVTKLRPKSRKGRIVKTYDYTNEGDELLFQTVRYEDPKDFRQRRPNGSGGWQWNLNGTRRVLYRLPELLKADKDAVVYLCEGEKDADRLRDEGLTATTNAMGAKKWLEEYTETLAGQHVVVLEDNDKDGREHVELVARSLSGKAASVKVLKLPGLPGKGDAFDWFAHGGTVQELERLAAVASEWTASPGGIAGTISAVELMAMEFKPTRFVIPDILPEGLSLLVGKPKKGKSWMSLGMCEAVATGGKAFGIKNCGQGDALYLALEDHPKRLQKRLRKVLDGRSAPERMYFHTQWPRLGEGGAEALDEWLCSHPETRLVVIDTLAKIRKPAHGQNIYTEDYAALEELMPLAAEHSINISVVHHLRKMAAADPMDEISSSTGLTAGVDGFMILRR